MNAIFTLVKQETVLLPKWLEYYSKLFDYILVMNHDGNVDNLKGDYKFEERKIGNLGTNHEQGWIVPLVIEQQKALYDTGKYQKVVYAEADEFLIANPYKFKNLTEYMETIKVDYVHAKAYEVIQIREEEKAIDWKKPLLAQRKYWVRYIAYDKPLIGNGPIDWAEGFHNLKGKGHREDDILPHLDENLYLIHIPRIDWDLHKTRAMWRYKGDDGRFYEKFDMKEEIPDKFKEIL